jgi:recombination protein RecA
MSARKKMAADAWIAALAGSGLEVQSARDALQVKGYLDTGNYALNWALSGRLLSGYPLGHCGEIYGDPATGKSFLATRAIAMMQARGGVALLDDTEHAYNAERAARLGVQVDTLAYRASRTVKEHLQAAVAFTKALATFGGPGILVLDSLAQLSTEHELEVRLDKRDMSKAAELKAFYRIIFGDMAALPMVHLATNHTIAAIGNMFQTRTTGGGGGPKFMASWRLDMRATSKIRRGDEVVGMICRAVVDKNRLASPFREIRLTIPFYEPISRASGLMALLSGLGVVTERGSFTFYQGQKVGRAYKGKDRTLDQDALGERLLDQYPEVLEETDHLLHNGKVGGLAAGGETAVFAEEGDADAEPAEVADV